MARIEGLPSHRATLTARLAWRSIRRRFGAVGETWRIVAHQPWMLRGWGAFELCLDRARLVDANKLKELAVIKASMVVGCEACVDVHAFLGRGVGITEEQLRNLAHYCDSDALSPLKQRVLAYAEAMSRTPVEVSDELFAALRAHFSAAQLVELTAAIAQENFRARFNRPFRVAAVGFSQGSYCPLPERPPSAPPRDDHPVPALQRHPEGP